VTTPANKPANGAVFTKGSILRHVIVMTSTGAIGLVSIFFVDVINLFYISLLGQQELAAAIGYAATIMFFTLSISIGCLIATTAITARAIGAGDEADAKRKAAASLVYMTVIGIVVTAVVIPLLPVLLDLLGATGETRRLSLEFMQIAIPSFPLMCLGMGLSGLLRAVGDAKRAMYVTLSSGVAALVVDPILIFGFGLGIYGAAISVCLVRVIFVLVGLHGVVVVHKMLQWPDRLAITANLRPFATIAGPAVLTQIATPIGNAYVTASMAEFGDDAVAGWAIVGRIMPLAFAAVFSLSGAIGPILSQNLGAGHFDRVSRTMIDSLRFALVYCLVVWGLLAILHDPVARAFNAEGDAYALIRFFCLFVAGSFLFNGALFTANAAFNNLGYPVYSTIFNWGRATLGIIPFVYVGSQWGAEGVLAGWGIGGIVFGIVSVFVCFRAIAKLPARAITEEDMEEIKARTTVPTKNSPFTSGRGSSL
jgi:putative MATE family efflux protein